MSAKGAANAQQHKQPQPKPANEEILAILRAADEIIAQGGRTLLAKILKGSRDKTVIGLELHNCPAYGALRHYTLEQIMEKIDWMIQHDFLEIQYSGKLPMLVFTDRGWTIEREQRAYELLREWDTRLGQGVAEIDMTYLKDRNRGMVLLFLDKVKESGDRRYIPYLRQWERIDYKKVQAAIRETIGVLERNNEEGGTVASPTSAAAHGASPVEISVPELEPEVLKCWECGERFVFEVGEQKLFRTKGFVPPKRCPKCRELKWLRNMGIDVYGILEDEDEDGDGE